MTRFLYQIFDLKIDNYIRIFDLKNRQLNNIAIERRIMTVVLFLKNIYPINKFNIFNLINRIRK